MPKKHPTKIRSRRSKGRQAEFWSREVLAAILDIPKDDIIITSPSAKGADLYLKDDYKFQLAIEVKNRQRVSFWKHVKQAKQNAKKINKAPALLLRYQKDAWICLPIEVFAAIIALHKKPADMTFLEYVKFWKDKLPKLKEAKLT